MVIVIATQNEIELVKRFGYEGNPIIITGVGGVNVIRALKHLPKDTEIVNIGYAGSKTIKKGTVLDITFARTHQETADIQEDYGELEPANEVFIDDRAYCYTSTDFVTHTNKEEWCVFDMELAFICAMFDNVKSIKVVSDNLSLKEYEKNVEKKDAD